MKMILYIIILKPVSSVDHEKGWFLNNKIFSLVFKNFLYFYNKEKHFVQVIVVNVFYLTPCLCPSSLPVMS